jgi:endonuclease/exonuclease/phosphatase family metal-dependent hydrolase
MAESPPQSDAPADVAATLRVATYNIRKGKGHSGRLQVGMDSIGGALAGEDADVVLCQEVFHCARTGASQSERLGDALGLSPYYGANKHRTVGHHGNATFTRLEVEHAQNHDISTNPIERRGVLHTRVAWRGTTLHVFNVHLGLGGRQRFTQLARIAELFERNCAPREPVLFAGDFNDWTGRLHAAVTELGFESALGDLRTMPTWHARRPVLSLDRIYTKNLQTVRGRRLEGSPWSELSDHLPLIADLET